MKFYNDMKHEIKLFLNIFQIKWKILFIIKLNDECMVDKNYWFK